MDRLSRDDDRVRILEFEIRHLILIEAELRARNVDLENSLAAAVATLSDVTRAAAALLADRHWKQVRNAQLKCENERLKLCLNRYLTNEYGSLADSSSEQPVRTYRPRRGRPVSGSERTTKHRATAARATVQ